MHIIYHSQDRQAITNKLLPKERIEQTDREMFTYTSYYFLIQCILCILVLIFDVLDAFEMYHISYFIGSFFFNIVGIISTVYAIKKNIHVNAVYVGIFATIMNNYCNMFSR